MKKIILISILSILCIGSYGQNLLGKNKKPDVIVTDGHSRLVTTTPGHVSTDNSSSATLIGDAAFTGEWESIVNYGIVVISVTSDVASATDGLMVQFSSDGQVSGIVSDDDYTVSAGAKKTFSFQAAAAYFRVVYTNGTNPQTSFNLHTVLKPYYVKPSSHRIQDAIVDDDDAELVKVDPPAENKPSPGMPHSSTELEIDIEQPLENTVIESDKAVSESENAVVESDDEILAKQQNPVPVYYYKLIN